MYNFIKILDTILANYLNLLNKLYKNNKVYLLLLLYATYNILSTLLTLIFRRKVDLTTNWLKDARKKYGIKEHPPPIINKTSLPGFNGGNWYGYGSKFNTPEYNSIPLRGNHDRDREGTIMMRGWWPEFRWFEYPNTNNNSKVYRLADQDITRLLYNNRGEILSVICPQFGFCVPGLGCVRIEITITHVKGWIDEVNKKCRGHVKFMGQIWIDDYSKDHPPGLIKYITNNYKGSLPFSKKHSIKILGFNDKELKDPLVELKDMNNIKPNLHKEAYTIIGLSGYFGGISNTENKFIDNVIVDIANIVSSNMFVIGNKMTWEVYGTHPELVNMDEYLKHVKELKHSIELTKNNPLRQKQVPPINEYGEIPNIEIELLKNLIYKFS
jgi:hypothetical protein